jgi:hypothetical protein
MRHRSIALALAVLAAFVATSVAVAGGWAQVTADNAPVDPPAGEETTIDLEVLQHGVTPVSWPRLTVVATDAASGTVIRTEAKPKGPEGSYAATLTFPSAGEWSLTFESVDLIMQGAAAINVTPPMVAAPGPGTPAVGAPVDPAPWVVLLVVAMLALIATGGLALRRRGAPGEIGVSVRS